MIDILVKCVHCSEKTERESMEKVLVGKQNRYIHQSCHSVYMEEQEKKQIEAAEWSDLYETIKVIHEVDIVPTGVIKLLTEIRNGTIQHNGVVIKKYKEGVNYRYITAAYNMVKPTIDKYRKNKPFETKEREIRYCLAIVKDKINDAIQLERKKQRQQFKNELVNDFVEHIVEDDDVAYKKTQTKNDISQFLD